MSKNVKRSSIVIPTLAEDKAITAAAYSDPDAQPLTSVQLNAMVPMKGLRGRPRPAHEKQLLQCATVKKSSNTLSPPETVGNHEWTVCF